MNFLQVIVNSLPQMAIYSLATIGIVLIFRTTGTTNFAQGLIATLGTFMTTQMALYAGLPLWLGLIIGMAVAFLMGIFMDVVLIRNARKINASGKQMITMGMLLRRISVIRGAKIWRQKAVKIQFLIKKQRFSSHSFRRVTTFFLLKIS